MVNLLEAADVSRGDGNWTQRVDFDAYGCILASRVDSICDPAGTEPLSGPALEDGEEYEDLNAGGGDAPIFAVSTYFHQRLMCSREEQASRVQGALDIETEKALGRVLQAGVEGSDLFLESSLVQHVAAGSNAEDSLVAALQTLWTKATGVGPSNTLIHLGMKHAFSMAGILTTPTYSEGFAGRLVTNPLYDADLIAVTGPIEVNIGDDQIIETTNPRNNRGLVLANRLASISFDPCQAVRVGTPAP